MVAAVLMVVVLGSAVALVVAAFGGRDRLQPPSEVVEAFCRRHGLPTSTAVSVVVDRMLTRHRSWRFHGGAFGLLAAVVIALLRPGGFRIGAGIGGSYFPDIVVCVLAGVLGGVVAAESHHLRPPRRDDRATGGTVSLVVREPATFIEPERRLARLAACVVGLLLAVVASTGGEGRVVVWSSVVVMLGTTGVVEWQQRRIVSRARPALPADLAAADAVVRREAIGALHHAGNGLVCLLLANAFAAVAGTGGDAFAVLGLGLFVVAVVEWRRSRLWIVSSGSRVGVELA